MTTTRSSEEIVNEMTDRIVRQFAPIRIVLFGSRARGEATEDSDIDLLVVLPHADDPREESVAVMTALSDLEISKDVIVTTPEEIAKRGHVLNSLLRNALEEGMTLYER